LFILIWNYSYEAEDITFIQADFYYSCTEDCVQAVDSFYLCVLLFRHI